MDSLEDFEKSLAAEKVERERADRDRDREDGRHRKHRHHHRHESDRHDGEGEGDKDKDKEKHRHRRHRDGDEDGHRSKRSRHSRDDDEHRSSRHHHHGDRDHDDDRDRHRDRRREDRHHKTSDAKEDLPQPDEEKPPSQNTVDTSKPLQRDSWMTAPSAIDIDYVHRPEKAAKSPPKPEPKRIVHHRELNTHIEDLNAGKDLEDLSLPVERTDYTFGDAGSSWRMTKLRTVFAAAEESGRPVEEIASDRYGNLQDFDDAREEKEELERRKIYGKGYKGSEKPTGELHQERLKKQRHHESAAPLEIEQGTIVPEKAPAATTTSAPPIDQTALNRLRAGMMKAKLRRAPNAAQLEQEYNLAAASFAASSKNSEAVVLGVMDNRHLAGTRAEAKAVTNTKRGRERGTVEENTDMTIEDMVREERRTKGQSSGLRMAERIAKDGKFDNDLDYMDENAEKLAKRVHKSKVNLKNMAVNEFQKLNRILENCPLCHHDEGSSSKPPLAPIISLATRVFLTLPTEPEVSPGGACIVPTTHRTNLLECDDDEWEEIRNFMKSLTRMYHEQGRDVVFYENAANPQRHLHAAMMAIPIPYEEGATIPAYFKEAFLSSDEEWSQHKKVIDTAAKAKDGLGRMAFRRTLAKEMPYFHVWFNLDGGLGHVVEDSGRWPNGDLFAREVIGGVVDAEPHIIKKQGRWTRGDRRVDGFKKAWRKFDWTRVLAEG